MQIIFSPYPSGSSFAGGCGFESLRGGDGRMDVYCECCVLSGGGLWVRLITSPEEFYRLYVPECDFETLTMTWP